MDKKDYGYSYEITWQEQSARLYMNARITYDLGWSTAHDGLGGKAAEKLWKLAAERQDDARRFFDANSSL